MDPMTSRARLVLGVARHILRRVWVQKLRVGPELGVVAQESALRELHHQHLRPQATPSAGSDILVDLSVEGGWPNAFHPRRG